METGELIKKLRLEHNMTQEQLGEQLGVGKTAIVKYEKGQVKNLKRDTIQKLAEIFRVSPIDFLDLDLKNGDLQKVQIIYNDYFPLKYNTNLSAGSLDEIMDSEPNAVVYVPIKFQTKKEQLKAFKVNGSSMNNVIPDESIVVTEPVGNALDIKDGTIVAAWYEGMATVKRFYKSGNIVTLMPDSSDRSHQPIMINTEIAPVEIIGRVVWHMNPDNINQTY